MLVIGPGNILFSTLHGWDGSKEVREELKRLRLDRSALKNEGHPINEHIVLPWAKAESLSQRLHVVGPKEMADIQMNKRPGETSQPLKVSGSAPPVDEAEDFRRSRRGGKKRDTYRRAAARVAA